MKEASRSQAGRTEERRVVGGAEAPSCMVVAWGHE